MTGPVLCRIVPLDCLVKVLANSFGLRLCAGNWVKISPQNSSTMQFDTKPSQSYSATLKWPM